MNAPPSNAPLFFTVSQRLAKPAMEVYQAIANPDISTRYFMQSSSGPMVRGATITWMWPSVPPISVRVDEAVPGELIRFRWEGPAKMDDTTVVIKLSAHPSGQTLIEITESGWSNTPQGLHAAFDNCSGWQHMLLCLKAWMLHGIELR